MIVKACALFGLFFLSMVEGADLRNLIRARTRGCEVKTSTVTFANNMDIPLAVYNLNVEFGYVELNNQQFTNQEGTYPCNGKNKCGNCCCMNGEKINAGCPASNYWPTSPTLAESGAYVIQSGETVTLTLNSNGMNNGCYGVKGSMTMVPTGTAKFSYPGASAVYQNAVNQINSVQYTQLTGITAVTLYFENNGGKHGANNAQFSALAWQGLEPEPLNPGAVFPNSMDIPYDTSGMCSPIGTYDQSSGYCDQTFTCPMTPLGQTNYWCPPKASKDQSKFTVAYSSVDDVEHRSNTATVSATLQIPTSVTEVPIFNNFVGSWVWVGSGVQSQQYTESVTFTNSDAQASANGWTQSETLASQQSFKLSDEFSASVTETTSNMITQTNTDTITKTEAKSFTKSCTSQDCSNGVLYQWQTEAQGVLVTGQRTSGTIQTCNFVCVPSKVSLPPQCPLGACNDAKGCQCCKYVWIANDTSATANNLCTDSSN